MGLKLGNTNIGNVYLGSTKIKEIYLGSTKVFGSSVDPYNPLNLPPYTIRLKYQDGVTPTFSKGTGVQISSSPNIWDLTYENSSWYQLLYWKTDLLEVLGANSTGVTTMRNMFINCSSLTSVPLFDTSSVTRMDDMLDGCSSLTTVPLFDTSSVTNMSYMLQACSSLTTVPLFDTSSVTNMTRMLFGCSLLTSIPLFNTSKVTNITQAFSGCVNVQSGALALYQQVSTQANPPSSGNHYQTFKDCGSNTTTGSAELAQIPSSWK